MIHLGTCLDILFFEVIGLREFG